MSAFRTRHRRKLKNEINVVPYIDVMLVLLIIFMVTAPLLNLGVEIELPQADAKPLDQEKKDPVVVEITADGRYYLTLQGAPSEEITPEALEAKVAAFMRQNPTAPVFIAGDHRVDYGVVMQGMALLQRAGVPKIGMMTAPPDQPRR
ncbi:protein TolR [Rehaibacterium terrae]|uniref:Tol-Pal system protein TolR n=1 Tax=Rehaibacterium terrae TaxID=1341696 RepID=A0A7W7XZ60_9GAMM|nr:protein TolR [Rehaibacterium terrae]MBB5015134.1 biopolymer transport protein TolR [Rehaibacterium terrae]